jgi:mono/diheme cytochrome c family protein
MRALAMPLLVAVAVLPGRPTAAREADPFTLSVEVGPVEGAPRSTRAISFRQATRRPAQLYDVQDQQEHRVRGASLSTILAQLDPPKTADTILFLYTDGMQIPVRLADKRSVDAIFIAFEHGDVMDHYGTIYPLRGWQMDIPCPKVVYSAKPTGRYTIWRYPTQLAGLKLVTWKLHEAALAQPTRKLPDRSGWPLYMQHCQPCHGVGGQGAARGPDLLTGVEGFRKVPAHAETGWDEHPSLHEQIKGFTDGTMPVLEQVSNADITKLWAWLRAIHRGATK